MVFTSASDGIPKKWMPPLFCPDFQGFGPTAKLIGVWAAGLAPGDTVVLYTDGVLEARREGELYGFERLDAIASAARELSARDIAETILADCRDFAANELVDDCAVVVVKHLSE